MFFHSFIFLVLFLPITTAIYHLALHRKSSKIWFLIFASLFFYGYWDYRLIPLLVGSVILNWLGVELFFNIKKNYLIALSVFLNLGLIAVFKYANFFADSLAMLLHYQHTKWSIILPLGISFFTFQQIAYLVDVKRGKAEKYTFRDYALHIVFFPHLIAGPIVKHNDIIAQFENIGQQQNLSKKFGQGMTMFILGMGKKVLLADNLAKLADPLFKIDNSYIPNFVDSWMAALSYGFQVYFDFSGYSDMAIGLALMFGFIFPENFNSPYKAASIQEFWRKWHITLSNLIRDYLYIPLGGSRRGFARQIAAILISMTLCGLWHGAAFGYVLWGFIHGIGLVINNSFRKLSFKINKYFSWLITFVFVMVSWIFFRAIDLATSIKIFKGLFSFDNLHAYNKIIAWRETKFVLAAFIICLTAPTSSKIIHHYLKPYRIIAALLALFFIYLLLYTQNNDYKSFIYFTF